ncbi:MAG: Tm-1-like ATP-binding domain-containing protein, partial [Planctomycetota bacterium]
MLDRPQAQPAPAATPATPAAFVVGTCDTKGEELRYVRDLIRGAGLPTVLVDVGTRSTARDVDVTAAEVMAAHPDHRSLDGLDDRGLAVTWMSEALAAYLTRRCAAGAIGGVIGLGGGGNTTLVTHAMQALPVGLPKLMVSTLAAGNVAAFIGGSDITLMYAVTDIAGLNSISRRVLANAAHAMAGMVRGRTAADTH